MLEAFPPGSGGWVGNSGGRGEVALFVEVLQEICVQSFSLRKNGYG